MSSRAVVALGGALVASTLGLSACAHPVANAAAVPAGRTTAKPAAPRTTVSSASPPLSPMSLPSVGTLYKPGQTSHFCTASVVAGETGGVVLTAAHCLAGNGVGYRFVPGEVQGRAPVGSWAVTAAYVDAAWTATEDPQRDYVFLTVARGDSRLDAAVGGGEQLGAAAAPGTRVRLYGYLAGSGDTPLSCSALVRRTGVHGTVDCPGFGDGTSGSPWLLEPVPGPGSGSGSATVVGLTGGLHQGGCFEDTSHTATFDADTAALLARAVAGGPGDTVRVPDGDGC